MLAGTDILAALEEGFTSILGLDYSAAAMTTAIKRIGDYSTQVSARAFRQAGPNAAPALLSTQVQQAVASIEHQAMVFNPPDPKDIEFILGTTSGAFAFLQDDVAFPVTAAELPIYKELFELLLRNLSSGVLIQLKKECGTRALAAQWLTKYSSLTKLVNYWREKVCRSLCL